MPNTKSIGNIGEQLAVEYLKNMGYTVLERNARYCDCEVDIICECYVDSCGNVITPKKHKSGLIAAICRRKDGVERFKSADRVVVFCEVKTRSGDEFGSGAEAITRNKMRRYLTAAKAYIARKAATDTDIRFDVIEVCDGEINHIVSAFDSNF